MKISLLKLVALAACVASAMAGTIVPKGYSADASATPASAMVDAKMPGVVAAAHQQLGSFWDKVKHDAEEAAKHLAEEEAKKLAEELAEKALEAAAAALLGSTHRPVLAPTADDLERVKIVHAVNAAKTTWTAGLNSRFLGRPMSAVKRQLGVKSVKKLPERERFVVSPDALPTNFDSRTQWPNCKTIQEVRDQSDCGSCWAFGAVEAASDRICIDTNGADQAHLSAEDMVGCCSACGYGCDGGDPGSAWEYLASTGIVTGGNYNDYSWCSAYSLPNCDHHVSGQYAPCGANEYPTPACPSACDSNSTYATPFQNDAHIFNSSYSVSADPTQIQMEIMTNGPVEAAFTVYSDFEAYKSGVYQHTTGDELGGHAVKILGWGVDAATSTPYWLVANSWNVDWGEKGFFRILRGSDECGIEDSIVAGLYSGK